MTKSIKTLSKKPVSASPRKDKERLAKALKANLARRKASHTAKKQGGA